MENEILNQILNELKDVKENQRRLEGLYQTTNSKVTELAIAVYRDSGTINSIGGRLTGIEDEIRELKADVRELKADVGELKADVAGLTEQQELTNKAVLRLELVEMPRIQAALDGFGENKDKLQGHEKRINRLENISEDHAIEIDCLKTAK